MQDIFICSYPSRNNITIMRLFLFTLVLQFLFATVDSSCYAQEKQRSVSGKIISFEESFPLKDVSVLDKSGKFLTRTQANGTYSLTISINDKLIIIKSDGYESKEVSLGNAREYNIVLKKKE